MNFTPSTTELDMEEAALLPAREVMSTVVKVVELGASNTALAFNGLSWLSSASAVAGQSIVVVQ